jgi:hypothetical protein
VNKTYGVAGIEGPVGSELIPHPARVIVHATAAAGTHLAVRVFMKGFEVTCGDFVVSSKRCKILVKRSQSLPARG